MRGMLRRIWGLTVLACVAAALGPGSAAAVPPTRAPGTPAFPKTPPPTRGTTKPPPRWLVRASRAPRGAPRGGPGAQRVLGVGVPPGLGVAPGAAGAAPRPLAPPLASRAPSR